MDLAAATRLSSIVTQMELLQTQIQDRRRQLNYLLISVRTMDPARREARIEDARERIRALERRVEMLRNEQQEIIVLALAESISPSGVMMG